MCFMEIPVDSRKLSTDRAGWPITAWCFATSISRAKFYTLPAPLRPKSVQLGKRHIIIEQPGDWLSRLAQAQADAAQ